MLYERRNEALSIRIKSRQRCVFCTRQLLVGRLSKERPPLSFAVSAPSYPNEQIFNQGCGRIRKTEDARDCWEDSDLPANIHEQQVPEESLQRECEVSENPRQDI